MNQTRKGLWAVAAGLIAGAILGPVRSAHAADCVWTGTVSTDWATTGNWSDCQGDGSAPPGSGDSATINSFANQPTISSNVTLAALTLNSGTILTVNSGSLTVNGNVDLKAGGGDSTVVNNLATITQTSGTTTLSHTTGANGSIYLSGSGGWYLSSLETATSKITAYLSDGSTYTVAGDITRSGGSFEPGESTVIMTGSGRELNGPGAHSFYDLVIAAGASVSNPSSAGNLTIDRDLTVEGTFTQDPAKSTTFTYDGDSTLSGGGTISLGRVTVQGGTTLRPGNQDFTVTGSTWSVSGGGTFDGGSATVTFGGSSTAIGGNGSQVFNNVLIASGMTLSNSTNGKSFDVRGNWTNNGTYVPGTETITFNGASPQAIGGTSPTTFNGITVNNPAGVTLANDATVNGVLTLTSGDLVTGSNTLTLGSSATTSGERDVVGNVKRSGMVTGTTYSFGNPNVSLKFAGGGGGSLPSEVTMSLAKSAPGVLTTAVQRTYTVSPTGGAGYSATLRLRYLEGEELNGLNEGVLELWRFDGTRWVLQPVTSRDTSANWIERSGVTEFSDWAMATSGAGSPTDVTLSSFTARAAPARGTGLTAPLAAAATIVIVLSAAFRKGRHRPE